MSIPFHTKILPYAAHDLLSALLSAFECCLRLNAACCLRCCLRLSCTCAGNSGGPALRGDVVVGVAFQNVPNADNIGYIIPLPVVRRFME